MREYKGLNRRFQNTFVKLARSTANTRWNSPVEASGGRGISCLKFKIPLVVLTLLLMSFYVFSSDNSDNPNIKIVKEYDDQLL